MNTELLVKGLYAIGSLLFLIGSLVALFKR